MTHLRFEVRGMPVPQGSGRSFIAGGKARHVTTSSPLLAWRGAIATEARAAMAGRPLLSGPVYVGLDFWPKPRPASHYLPANSRRPRRELRLDAPTWNDGTPDADKLARAALDALTGVVFRDDGQVAFLAVGTSWPAEDGGPGVLVDVRTLEVTR